jgi:hypothetical protein
MKPLACQNLRKNHEADFGDLNQFDTKFFDQRPEPIFEKQKLGKLPPLKMPDLNKRKLLLKTKTLICKTQ